MNNQEEVFLRKSKWSGRRVVLFYWFAIAFMGTAAAAGLGTTLLEPSFKYEAFDHSGMPDPFHPEDCDTCHSSTVDSWNATAHSDASSFNGTHVLVGAFGQSPYNLTAFNASSCAHCMATGWENSTGTPTYESFGVTCAACHSAPGVVNDTIDTCGKCHGQADEVSVSAHSNSLDDLLTNDHAADYCLHCMSGQGQYANTTGLDPFTDPSLTSINCATCHDPHDPTNDHQLREAETQDLCGTCHGGSSRHTTYDMLTDATTPSAHGNFDCTECHGYYWGTDHGQPAELINHTWTLVLEDACDKCHVGQNATRIAALEDIQTDVTALMTEIESQVTNVSAKVDQANDTSGVDQTKVDNAYALIDEAEALLMFVEADESTGFHNPDLAEQKLQLALTKLDEAYAAAVDATPADTTTTTKGTSASGILLALSILSVVVLFRKKRR
ncbi:MAG: ammonia-forming cytochrome c nitrite reductase subunit c552 [Candidatus Hodarchaeales archaeon]|jgi:predicted CXXCH cytochrome family protein